MIVACERVINLSPNAGRFALVEPIVGAMRHVPGRGAWADAPGPARNGQGPRVKMSGSRARQRCYARNRRDLVKLLCTIYGDDTRGTRNVK